MLRWIVLPFLLFCGVAFFAAAFFAPGARAQVAASEVWLLAPITPGDCVQFGTVFGSLVDSGGACGGGGGTLAVTATTSNTNYYPVMATNSGASVSTLYVDKGSPWTYNPSTGLASFPNLAASGYVQAGGQITSTVSTGTAPFIVASTTNVANLNASSLSGATFAAPGAIGGGTAAAGTFTTLTSTESVISAPTANTAVETLTGGSLTGSSATTLFNYAATANTSGVETIWQLALTNTASGAGALLMNALAGASGTTSEFSVGVTGNVVINGTITAANLSTSGTIAGSICSTSAGLLLYETNGCTIPLNTGSGAQALTAPNNYFVCTTTCTVTPPVPVAGYQFCVRNDDAATTVITLGGNTNIYYEKTNYNGYGTVSGTIASGGALGDKMCIVGRDATHYIIGAFVGTWIAS